ncbi:MAG: ABC transporter substrate-binding protein [Myxococcota bacterium]|nr:ABC transporter substrate-binding protein [Myxococcota bacterium]
MFVKKNIQTGLVGLLLVLATTSISHAQVFAYPEDTRPSSLLPFFADDMSAVRMVELIFDGLVFKNKRGDFQGALAKDWTVDPDNRGIRFTLREGVKWHDGRPFSAEDVVFTVNAAKNPKTIFTGSGKFNFIAAAKAEGRNRVYFSFRRPVTDPQARFVFKIIPKHKFNGTAINRRDAFSRKPVGTGPYRVTRFTLRQITLEVNQDYWSPARISRVVMQHTPDKAAQVNLLQYSGGKAGVQAVIFLPPKNIPLFENSDTIALEPYHTVSWWYVAFNHENKALGDPVVRNAIVTAIDRDELLQANLGRGDILTGPFTEASPFYDFDIEMREPDSEQASEMLQRAGYVMKDGVRTKGKTKLSFRFVLDKEMPEQQSLFLGIQAQLKKVGIKVDPLYLDHAAYKETVWKREKYDLTLNVWSFEEVEDVRPLFHSSGSLNFINYNNPKVDQLLDAAQSAADYKTYKRQMKALHALVHKDLPYMFLWSLDVYSGISKRVRKVFIAPYYYFTTFREWELKR